MRARLHDLAGLALALSAVLAVLVVVVLFLAAISFDLDAQPSPSGSLGVSGLIGLWIVGYIVLTVLWFAMESEEETDRG